MHRGATEQAPGPDPRVPAVAGPSGDLERDRVRLIGFVVGVVAFAAIVSVFSAGVASILAGIGIVLIVLGIEDRGSSPGSNAVGPASPTRRR